MYHKGVCVVYKLMWGVCVCGVEFKWLLLTRQRFSPAPLTCN